MNSALSAVCENDEKCMDSWYPGSRESFSKTDGTINYSHMKEMSRSESSLYQEVEDACSKMTDIPFNKSEKQIEINLEKQIKRTSTFSNSSSNNSGLKKGHSRSKSEQLSSHLTMNFINDLDRNFSTTSSSLPKDTEIGKLVNSSFRKECAKVM